MMEKDDEHKIIKRYVGILGGVKSQLSPNLSKIYSNIKKIIINFKI